MCIYLEKAMNNAIRHITQSEDLITTYEETRAGFIDMSLEKNRRATPFVEEARTLQYKIKEINTPEKLLDYPEIRNGLIAASGISDKAASHLGEDGAIAAANEFIRNFLIPAGAQFKEELVFRFLLTKGDSLGGKMRNIVGAIAQRKLCKSIISVLRLANILFYAIDDTNNQWVSSKNVDDDTKIENSKGFFWVNTNGDNRLVYFNTKVPIVKNNVDIILLNIPYTDDIKEQIKKPENYIALGELKGGIDPAGADEHWKTGKMAMERIDTAFKKCRFMPHLFFIGAAIERKMAGEIYDYLQSGFLSNAANLTKPEHITALVDWLVSL
jgi:type II restriction enzyme